MANHSSTRTPQLYDRRSDQVSLDEIERVAALPEDQRRMRALRLWEQWQDACRVAEAVRPRAELDEVEQRRRVELENKARRHYTTEGWRHDS